MFDYEIRIGSVPGTFLITENNSLDKSLVRVSHWSGLKNLR